MSTPFYLSLRFWRRVHLWLSLLLSFQLLAWFGSGLVMSWLSIEEVRGNHLRKPPVQVDWTTVQLSPAQLLLHHGIATTASSSQLQLTQRHTLPVYHLIATPQRYFNAVDGHELQPLTTQEVAQLAKNWYHGEATTGSPILLEKIPLEARGLTPPVWQVQFHDADKTTFYLDPMLGQLLRVRTDTWRLFDFVWMLHIMDYEERDDFNHPLLILTSTLAFLFTLTGIILLIPLLKRKYAS